VLHLLVYLRRHESKIEEATGKESIFRFPGAEEIEARVYLPLKDIRGRLHEIIDRDDFDPTHFTEMNDASIAFSLRCHGHEVLLTGDSTLSQWGEHRRQMKRGGVYNLEADFLKVPHHGSKNNNNEDLYSYFFRQKGDGKHVFISADGREHPHNELFSLVHDYGLKPHCTNLSRYCIPLSAGKLRPMHEIPPPLRNVLANYIEEIPIPCQGDITLTIGASGFSVTTINDMLCAYRQV